MGNTHTLASSITMNLNACVMAILAASLAAAPQREMPGEARLTFEAATIKRAAPDAVRNQVVPTSPNRLYIPGMTLAALIYNAYGDGGFNTSMRVTGGPDWINSTVFAVEGIAASEATPRQLRLMLRALLEDRFALTVRDATDDLPMGDVLTLVVARGDGTLGPKVRKWDGTCPPVMPMLFFQAPRRPLLKGLPLEAYDPAIAYCPTGYRNSGIRIDGATMFTVAEILSLPPSRALLGTITQDRTGLTDRYTMELDYPFPPQSVSAAAAPADFAGPSLSTAVLEQWGLRLVPGTGRLRVITVDSARLPTSD